MTPEESIGALAAHVRAAVRPNLGEWRARRVTGIASSGDATFQIDEIAEAAVEEFLRKEDINVAYYSEDRGLVHPFPGREPEGVLIIDPIDGTRGAIAGFEACVVSVAWADYKPEPALKDVRYAAISEIKSDRIFTASQGGGVKITGEGGIEERAAPSPTTELDKMALTLGVVGAPLELIFDALRDVVNPTTVKGGFFILNSSAFELTRLLTGQLSGIIDIRARLLKEFPQHREKFIETGGGRLLSLYGYDLAAAARIVAEAGCPATDAWGRSLEDWKLLDTTESNFGSLIAASNPTLHMLLLEKVEEAFARLHA